MLLKTHIVVHQTSIQDLFYRYDRSRTSRVLKSRVPGVLSAMGLSPSASEVQHLCDDFSDPKMAEYIAYKPIVHYVDALDIGDEELRSISVSASNATIDREIWAMLNMFREKLLARRRSPYDAFRGSATGGIAQKQFREGLANLGLVLREGEIQKLRRKYRCNLRADVDWAAFCRDIEASRTLDFGTA
jgi:Ca2+-binding EF-hand superfamily protein